jgi:membrane protein
VGIIVVFEVFIHKLTGNQVLNEQIPLIVMGGMVLILMILITTSILLNLVQSMTKQGPSYPLVLFYYSLGHYYFLFFWNLGYQFSQYNQLYGSIGTLLIMMFYIWINCMILLLGFELNATITKLKETVLLN